LSFDNKAEEKGRLMLPMLLLLLLLLERLLV
jgi:hypothetical protein